MIYRKEERVVTNNKYYVEIVTKYYLFNWKFAVTSRIEVF